MFEDFVGHKAVVSALQRMIEQERIAQTLLLHGPEGIGKATLARRFAQALLADPKKIEKDDLSLPENMELIAEREKLPTEKRVEDPLVFASHPDFLTFPPDGPLRQLSIAQMRLLKERSQFAPLKGNHRIFLIDHLDRANEQAANSLLKILEEPPSHLVLILTAENFYDLLPTIRSRAVLFHMTSLKREEMAAFVEQRQLPDAERRISLANGSPGIACALDPEVYDQHREAMLALLGAACRGARFSTWAQHAERIASEKTVKLDVYLKVLYSLLEDLVMLHEGGDIRNSDVRDKLEYLAQRVSFEWIQRATKRVDEIAYQLRRNIQKGIALDAMVLELRG